MLTKIINTSKSAMQKSKHVKINYKNLNKYIENIEQKNVKHWLSSNPYGILDLPIEKIINFMLLFDSIDYSFWGNPKWAIQTEEGEKDGSDALLYAMLKFIKETDIYDFTKISYNQYKEIIKGNVEIPLIKQRYETLYNISQTVNQKMNGNFYQYIKNKTKDTELLKIIIENFVEFKDERTYENETIYFYKLAQLLTSDILHIREMVEKTKVDYSHLVGCADYKIPQTLRALEIIEYDNELSRIIDNSKEIEYNSDYEVEIRASTIATINYIAQKLKNFKSIDINDYLFMESRNVKKISKPYHLCRNTNY